jgi:hypothetical protein
MTGPKKTLAGLYRDAAEKCLEAIDVAPLSMEDKLSLFSLVERKARELRTKFSYLIPRGNHE